jgi:hypothetical protein
MGFTKHIRLPECANGKADEEKLGCCVGLAITPTPRVCSAVLLCCCAAGAAVLLSPSTLCLEADGVRLTAGRRDLNATSGGARIPTVGAASLVGH